MLMSTLARAGGISRAIRRYVYIRMSSWAQNCLDPSTSHLKISDNARCSSLEGWKPSDYGSNKRIVL